VSGTEAALFGLLFTICACRSESARRFEGEVHAIGLRIDTLRNAPNEAKPELLGALSATACQSAPVCELKRTCVDAYTRHLAAVASIARARALLAEPDGGTSAALEAAGDLAKADLGLAQSKEQSERCASLQGELRRKARGDR